MSRTFIITGTGTGIGKTVFASALTGALGAYYWKPVQAGLNEDSDTEVVAALSGVPQDHILPEAYRLNTPCSPHRAAEIDGLEIDAAALSLPRTDGDTPLIVEGAGGALVPVNRTTLYADIFARWGQPTIIVAGTALGTINHSLMTIEALRARDVPIFGIAFVGDANEDSEATICAIGKVKRLGRLGQIVSLNRQALAEAFAAGFDRRDFA